MTGEELYKVYAPPNAKWVEWVRPVSFVSITSKDFESVTFFEKRNISFLPKYDSRAAIFVDLPGIASLEVAVSLAEIGYRPIPIFNGVNEQKGALLLVNNHIVQKGIICAGEFIKNIKLNNDASPAFLVDSSRLNTHRSSETIYDNSYDIYEHDLPSCKYFKDNGIDRIIIVSSAIHRDLKEIFLKYQDDGLEFYLTDGYGPIKKTNIKKSRKS